MCSPTPLWRGRAPKEIEYTSWPRWVYFSTLLLVNTISFSWILQFTLTIVFLSPVHPPTYTYIHSSTHQLMCLTIVTLLYLSSSQTTIYHPATYPQTNTTISPIHTFKHPPIHLSACSYIHTTINPVIHPPPPTHLLSILFSLFAFTVSYAPPHTSVYILSTEFQLSSNPFYHCPVLGPASSVITMISKMPRHKVAGALLLCISLHETVLTRANFE